jgi:putative acetyltransferase
MLKLIRATCDNNDFRKLVAMLDEDLYARNGMMQAQYEPFNKIDAIKNVVVAYLDDIPAGCGGYKKFDDESVEIKRMFVNKQFRKKGIARAILTELENWALENGFKKTMLETGIKQQEAISLYTSFGYSIIENFGQYKGNPNSLCMCKTLFPQ